MKDDQNILFFRGGLLHRFLHNLVHSTRRLLSPTVGEEQGKCYQEAGTTFQDEAFCKARNSNVRFGPKKLARMGQVAHKSKWRLSVSICVIYGKEICPLFN